jgi:hypothetical protein
MWVDIKNRILNLNHYHKIIKMIDECESYKDYCIKFYLKNGTKTEFTLISFKSKKERDDVFDRLHGKIVEAVA